MVGTLKPSISFVSLPSLQLAPLTPACSQLAPSSLPGVSHLVKLSLPDILIAYSFLCIYIVACLGLQVCQILAINDFLVFYDTHFCHII